MSEEVAIIRIIGDSAGAAISAGKTGAATGIGDTGKGKNSALGAVMTGVLHGVGIATGVGLVIQIASNMKLLSSIVQAIFKLVMAVLRPIEMVIVTLLMPVLFLLKPIVSAVNKIMQPYFQLAMTVMKAASANMKQGGSAAVLGGIQMAAATGIIFSGLNAVIVAVSSMLIQSAIDNALTGIGILMGAIIPGADGLIKKAQDAVDAGIKGTTAIIEGGIASQAILMATSVGVKTTDFQEKVKNSIDAVFYGGQGIPEGILKVIDGEFLIAEQAGMKALKGISETLGIQFNDLQTNGIIKSFDAVEGINETVGDQFGATKTVGTEKIKEAVASWNAEFDKLKKASGEEGGGKSKGSSNFNLKTGILMWGAATGNLALANAAVKLLKV